MLVPALLRRALTAVLLVLAAFLFSGCSGGASVESPEAAEAVGLIEDGAHTVIDVRTPAEYMSGHIEGATNIDLTSGGFRRELGQLDAGGRYLLYCQSGKRSAVAAEKMAKLGFSEVVDAGGILSLQAAGADVVEGE